MRGEAKILVAMKIQQEFSLSVTLGLWHCVSKEVEILPYLRVGDFYSTRPLVKFSGKKRYGNFSTLSRRYSLLGFVFS